jgi:aryl-alcohol dehydrogenase-like predicted oxidoreductase
MRAADAVRALATEKHVKPGQIALAWLLHKGADIVPIPGTKRRSFLEENVGAAEIKLSGDEMRRLEEALSPGQVSGSRYTPQMMALIDR